MAIICVDAGTTVIKAVGYDAAGAEAAVARRETVVTRPAPGHAEQDMHAVWDAVAATVREVAAQVGGADFVAVTAQGDGCWLVDADGEPTGPAILWNDARAAAVVDRWTRDGLAAEAFRVNGSSAASGLPHAVLAWLGEHAPGGWPGRAPCSPVAGGSSPG
ncbi:Xylulose kinase [[Actinomadura] parvosata subsp. kistnae]|nr:Xylulose kinase [Actinomadura parvosata subsp. kistnae]